MFFSNRTWPLDLHRQNVVDPAYRLARGVSKMRSNTFETRCPWFSHNYLNCSISLKPPKNRSLGTASQHQALVVRQLVVLSAAMLSPNMAVIACRPSPPQRALPQPTHGLCPTSGSPSRGVGLRSTSGLVGRLGRLVADGLCSGLGARHGLIWRWFGWTSRPHVEDLGSCLRKSKQA